MLSLERLHTDHATALLAFETENRAYFARSVPDRGDAYFETFVFRHQSLLDEQRTGQCHFHVVLDQDGQLVGRVNLVDAADGGAELGYRIGQRFAGRGLATEAVAAACRLAAGRYGLSRLFALVTLDNPASRAVLLRNGFDRAGDTVVEGRAAERFERELAATG